MPLAVLVCSMVVAQGRVNPAGTLVTPRTQHTATMLSDGRVLVAGGRSQSATDTLSSTELFDPVSNTWKPGPAMGTSRAGHTATMLSDGRVLVVGGTAPAADGSSRFDSLSAAEVFDAKRATWTAVGPLAAARNGHTATRLLDGSVLIIGGARPAHQHLTSVERFDPATNTFSSWRPLAVGRWLHDAVLLKDGSVVVLGGRSNAARADSGVTVPKPGVAIASVERLDVSSGVWHAVPDMSEPRQRTAVVSLGGRVAVFGGQTTTMSTNYVEWWEPGGDAWVQPKNHLTVPIAGHTATLLPSGDVLIAGGEPPSAIDTARVQRWVQDSERWCLAGQLKTSRKAHTATLLKDGSVLIAGGTSAGMTEATAERWVAAKGECVEP
jgi:N-acetylneuraminic acid mutarotase